MNVEPVVNKGGRPRKTSAWVEEEDRVYRADLRSYFKVSDETMRRWIRDGVIPPPDIRQTQRVVWWKRSTLAKAGIEIQPSSHNRS